MNTAMGLCEKGLEVREQENFQHLEQW